MKNTHDIYMFMFSNGPQLGR